MNNFCVFNSKYKTLLKFLIFIKICTLRWNFLTVSVYHKASRMEKENFNNTIGNKVRELRLQLNWNQRTVAKKLDISIPAFSKIETGITDINISRLEQIAALFEVSTHELLYDLKGKDLDTKNQVAEIAELKAAVARREQDIIQIQKKLIDLYEEVENLHLERLNQQ